VIADATTNQAIAQPKIAIAFSHGIRALRHVNVLADVERVVSPKEARELGIKPGCVLVWGRKSNTRTALQYAEKHNIAVQYLEDGWIRSCAENPHSRTCYSILQDSTGVYYDSRTPCDLENLLNLEQARFNAIATPEHIAYAKRCRTQLVQNHITKYNFTSQKEDSTSNLQQQRVLVVDQTRDDASVRFGAMDASGFENMLHAAINENPDAHITVRIHPDVVSGRRQGYLKTLAEQLGIEICASSINPLLMLKQVDKVYVGTSQLGYEALLCDKPVVVFGQPFYAGWGLSDDRSPITRRTQNRSIDELFYATHIAYARYCNPVTGKPWQLHECLNHVELQQRMFKQNALHFECKGITVWKRKYLRQYLRSPDGSVSFATGKVRHSSDLSAKLTWGFRAFDELKLGTSQAANTESLFRVEDGFLRSLGLGSDFNAPASLVVDGRGLYLDPARPSDLEDLLNEYECTPAEVFRAVKLKKLILSSRLSKYNVGAESNLLLPGDDRSQILVVGQVEDDESIQRGCDKVRKNADLLQIVRAANPDAWIRYKAHPDVVAGNRRGAVDTRVLSENANAVDADASIIDCIEACDELHTMTSLAGFEAMLRGKRGVTYGAPFYAGWGLSQDHQPIARRVRRRTLDELVYLSLIAYPRYVDIDTGEFTTPEDLVETIISHRAMNNNNKTGGWPARQISKVANIVRGLRYAP